MRGAAGRDVLNRKSRAENFFLLMTLQHLTFIPTLPTLPASIATYDIPVAMVSTRGTPAPPSSSRGKQVEKQQDDELLQVIQAMRQEISELRDQMNAPPVTPPTSSEPPVNPPANPAKDPRDRIKQTHVPKYDGTKTKEAETWILEFMKYCRLIRITEDDHILTAFAVAMTDKAAMWWEYAEKSLPHPVIWQTVKEAFLLKYGNVPKRQESANKLKKLYQGTMSIADFFTEVEDLNLYAGLDPETLPTFLKPGLNSALQDTLDVAHAIQPITNYANWKAKALHLGTNLEARSKKTNQSNKPKSDNKKPKNAGKARSGEARKDKDKATEVVQVPKSEKERRMKNGECVKCDKAGHIGKECRTGWKYDAAAPAGPAVTVIEEKKKRPASTQQNQSTQPQKRRLTDQPDGSIKTIASRIEELSDSGNE